jgi:hypothetical protein
LIYKLTKTGKYHLQNNQQNQDVVLSGENRRYAVIALADGVSECSRAGEGARLACETVIEMLLANGKHFLKFCAEKTADFVTAQIRYALKDLAELDGERVEEFSSTFACVLLDKVTKKMMYYNLGDSLVAATEQDKCWVLATPFDSTYGCCVTTTKNAEKTVKTAVVDASVFSSVVICSDGAWRMMYDRGRMKPDVKKSLSEQSYDALDELLNDGDSFDDYSYILIDFTKKQKNKKPKTKKERVSVA